MSKNSVLSAVAFSQMRQEMRPTDIAWLIDLFLNEIPKYMNDLEKSVMNQDSEALYFAAHKFKGSCANVGAESIFNICQQLEGLGESNDMEKASKIVQNDLKKAVKSVQQALLLEKQKLKY